MWQSVADGCVADWRLFPLVGGTQTCLFRGSAPLCRWFAVCCGLQCAAVCSVPVEVMSLLLPSSSPWKLVKLVLLKNACICKEPDRDVKEAEEVDSQ